MGLLNASVAVFVDGLLLMCALFTLSFRKDKGALKGVKNLLMDMKPLMMHVSIKMHPSLLYSHGTI